MRRQTTKLLSLRLIILAVLVFNLLLLGTDRAFSQTGISFVKITKLDTSTFPAVNIQAIILDSDGMPVSTLADNLLMLTENGEPVSYEYQTRDAGIQVVLAVDAGAGSAADGATGVPRLTEMRNLLSRYIDGMGENDSAMLVLQNERGTAVLQAFTADKDILKAKLSELSASPGSTVMTNGLAAILNGLQTLQGASNNGQAQAVLFLSSGVQTSAPVSFEDVIQTANQGGVPIHAILVNSNEMNKAGMYWLASETDGEYIFYDSDQATTALFTALQRQRTQCLLSYRSRLSSSGERTVQLAVNSEQPNAPRDYATYTVALQAPSIVIDQPTTGSPIVRQVASGADLTTAEPTSTTVVAHVVFPDGTVREIVSAQLLVNSVPTGAALTNPGNTLTFAWDLRPYQTLGDNSVQLQVQVQDELGMTGVSEPQLTTVKVTRVGTCAGLTGMSWILCWMPPVVAVLALLVAFATLGLVIYLWRTGKLSKLTETITETATSIYKKITQPAGGDENGKKADAFLTVVYGDSRLERRQLPIFKDDPTPIGRDPSLAKICFANDKVTARHCEIKFEDGVFKIRDFESKNGTFVNKDQLEVGGEGRVLKSGDEIALGPVGYGVLLKFDLASTTEGEDLFGDTEPEL